jgi:hypothetical protein
MLKIAGGLLAIEDRETPALERFIDRHGSNGRCSCRCL